MIHAVCVLFLDIKVDKTGEKVSESLKQFLTVPTLLFFSMISVVGLAWGASSYLGIYLQEELNAPPIIFSRTEESLRSECSY